MADNMHRINSCAVMGRISSIPVNFWTTIIDYSNFWWLQVRENVENMRWLATTATLTKLEYINGIFFREDVAVNEDVIFFDEISKKTNKFLSICAEETGEHHHNRKNFNEFFKYQFNNGKKGVLFRSNGINLINASRNVALNFNSTLIANGKFLEKNKLIKVGVLMSFIIFQLGIECKSLVAFFKKTNNFLIYGKLRQSIRKIYYAIKFKKVP
jgi:hypothetical protein